MNGPMIPLFVKLKTKKGFGDRIWMEMLSLAPSIAGNWLFGIGPTFISPDASSDFTGRDKWLVGPAAVWGYLSKKYILGVFLHNWTSIAGDSNRPNAILL